MDKNRNGIQSILSNYTHDEPLKHKGKKKATIDPNTLESLKTASSVVLAVIAGVGIVTLSAVAPNLIGALGSLYKATKWKHKGNEKHCGKKLTDTIYYLKQSGIIDIHKTHNDYVISLTELGYKKAEKLDLDGLTITKPKIWDGKWWLVAADIPTKDHRTHADRLRRKLIQMNFYPLQRTLWLYPYNPQKELDFLLHELHIEHYTTLMEINRLDRDDEQKAKIFFKTRQIL